MGAPPPQTGAKELLSRDGIEWLHEDRSPPYWQAGNTIVFGGRTGETENVFEVRLSPVDWKIVGRPAQRTHGPAEIQPVPAANGRLLFVDGLRNFDIWSVGLDLSRFVTTSEPTPLITGTARERQPSISWDGSKLVFCRRMSPAPDVFVWDSVARRTTPLIATPDKELRALVSPDGKMVVFERGERGNVGLCVIPTAGGTERRIAEKARSVTSWTWDSTRVIAFVGHEWVTIDVQTGETAHLIGEGPIAPTLCPDENWLVFNVRESESVKPTYIAPIHHGAVAPRSEWIRITSNQADGHSRWSPDGSTLYYSSNKDGFVCLWAQPLDPDSKQPKGPQKHIFGTHDPDRPLRWGWPLGLSANRFYYRVLESRANIWLAEPRRL